MDEHLASNPFQFQSDIRSNRFYAVTRPLPATDHGVKPLLNSGGGETAYVGLSDSIVAEKLNGIGTSRIFEVETGISDSLNAFGVSKAIVKSWAKSSGVHVDVEGRDIVVTECLQDAKVIWVHTQGDSTFANVGESDPLGFEIFEETSPARNQAVGAGPAAARPAGWRFASVTRIAMFRHG